MSLASSYEARLRRLEQWRQREIQADADALDRVLRRDDPALQRLAQAIEDIAGAYGEGLTVTTEPGRYDLVRAWQEHPGMQAAMFPALDTWMCALLEAVLRERGEAVPAEVTGEMAVNRLVPTLGVPPRPPRRSNVGRLFR